MQFLQWVYFKTIGNMAEFAWMVMKCIPREYVKGISDIQKLIFLHIWEMWVWDNVRIPVGMNKHKKGNKRTLVFDGDQVSDWRFLEDQTTLKKLWDLLLLYNIRKKKNVTSEFCFCINWNIRYWPGEILNQHAL